MAEAGVPGWQVSPFPARQQRSDTSQEAFRRLRWRERVVAHGERERFLPGIPHNGGGAARNGVRPVAFARAMAEAVPPNRMRLDAVGLPQAKHSSGKEADNPGYGRHERVPHQEQEPTPLRVVITPIARVCPEKRASRQPGCTGRGPHHQRADAMRYRGQR